METRIVYAIIMAVAILVVLYLVLGIGFTDTGNNAEKIENKYSSQTGDFLSALERVINLNSYPTASIKCTKGDGDNNDYQLTIKGLSIGYKGSETNTKMTLYPVLYFKGEKILADGNPKTELIAGESGGFQQNLAFTTSSTDPPIIDQGTITPGQPKAYTGIIYPDQSLYLGGYKITLVDFKKSLLTSYSNFGICAAKLYAECYTQGPESLTLYLQDMTKQCSEQSDPTTCSKTFDLCGKPITIEFTKIDNPPSLPNSIATCSGRNPIFSVVVDDYEKQTDTDKRKAQESQGIYMLGENYILGFWKYDDKHPDCYKSNVFSMGDCASYFLGAYSLRVPPSAGKILPQYSDPRPGC